MRKWKLWLLLGSSSFLVFFLLLVATAAGSFADDVTAAFGGRQASASESRGLLEARPNQCSCYRSCTGLTAAVNHLLCPPYGG